MTQATLTPAAPAATTPEPGHRAPLSAAEMAKVDLMVTQAKAKLVLQQPFYASLLLRRPLTLSYAVPTAGADAKGRIYLNPHFVAGKYVGSVSKLVFLLAHETLHIAFQHCHKSTMGERKHGACNIAMDKVINELLIADNVGEFIEGGQRHAGAEGMKWQDLYNEDDDNGGGPGGPGDDLIASPDGEPDPQEAERLQQQMGVELAQAAQAAKMQGKLSANIERVVGELLYVKTPWYTILERFMQAFVASDYSWKRPNRRFVGSGVYLPSLDKQPSMGEVVIGVDTSGSIGAQELALFSAHINRIIEQCVPEKVHVIYCDSQVAHTDTFEPDAYPITLQPHGGGGTNMCEVWRHAEANYPDAQCLVLLTDGYTPWPDEVTIPSVVLTTTQQGAPEAIAETVFFEEDA